LIPHGRAGVTELRLPISPTTVLETGRRLWHGAKWLVYYSGQGDVVSLKHVFEYLRAFDVPIRIRRYYGIRLSNSTPLGAMKGVFLFGIYTRHPEFLPGPSDVVADIGAQYGDYALLCAIHYRVRAVYSFEPNPVTFAVLVENARANDASDRILPFNLALGARSGVSAASLRGDMIVKPSESDRNEDRHTVTVATLDSVSIHPTLVKIDTEGFELDILRGSADTLAKEAPRVIVEAHSRDLRNQCVEFMEAAGYSLRHEDSTEQYGAKHDSATWNLFFLKPESMRNKMNPNTIMATL